MISESILPDGNQFAEFPEIFVSFLKVVSFVAEFVLLRCGMTTTTDSSSQPITLPQGGGALQGIGETFQANAFTGTGNFTIPIPTSPGRAGFGPQLSLQYSTGSGNGPFGLGWQLSIPRVTRKTEKGLPQYGDRNMPHPPGTEKLMSAISRKGLYLVTSLDCQEGL